VVVQLGSTEANVIVVDGLPVGSLGV
jgi:hypothetical protein